MTITAPKDVVRGTRRRNRGLLFVLLTGQTMASMDGSIVTVALPAIRVRLHASSAALQMIPSGYLLAFAVLVVTGARLGNLYGQRRMFLSGLAAFSAASLACGLAPSAGVLVGARIAQGAAGALMVPQVLSVIQQRFDGDGRARALGLYSMVLALGVALGQLAGGIIVSADLLGAGWRPIFLINVPVGAVLLMIGRRLLPTRAAATGTRSRLDLGGVVILSVTMTALVLPLALGREQGWPWWTWTSLVAGCAGLLIFGGYERRLSAAGADPLLDLTVLRQPGIKPGLLACFTVMGAYSVFLFTLSLHLQDALGFTPLHAGLSFVPYTAGFALAGLSWPRLPVRAHPVLPVAGLVAFALAATLLAVAMRGGWPVAASVPLLLIAGAGHAAGFSPLVARISATVGAPHAADVSALTNTGTLLSTVLSITGLGGVYLAIADHDVARSLEGFATVTAILSAALLLAAAGAARTSFAARRHR